MSNQVTGTENLGDAKTVRVCRDGDRDIKLVGWLIGRGVGGSGGTSGHECDWNRGVKVNIWLTMMGSIVIGKHFWSRWENESERWEAQVVLSGPKLAERVRLALIGEGDYIEEGAHMSKADKDAWENACDTWGPLFAEECEQVK